MGNINQVVVNGQNYEIEDKTARNYYPDTKQSAAITEENSYKIVDKNGNTIAEFKSDSDISILLGGEEENAVLKLTKDSVKIGTGSTKVLINGKDQSELELDNFKYDKDNNIVEILDKDNNDIQNDCINNIVILGNNSIRRLSNSIIIGKNNRLGNDVWKNNLILIGNSCGVFTDDIYPYSKGFIVASGNNNYTNAIVHINERTYITGIGGYSGIKIESSKSLQYIIADYESRIKKLEENSNTISDLKTRIAALEKNRIRNIYLSENNTSDKLIGLTIDDNVYKSEDDIKQALENIDYTFCKIYNNNYNYPSFIIKQNNYISFISINKYDVTLEGDYFMSETIINIKTLDLTYSE